MNEILRATIDAGLAALTRETDVPSAPFAFGSDLWAESDIAADAREVDGSDPIVVAQASVRRLDCPRGANPDDPDYGISIRDWLSEGISVSDLQSREGEIRNELSKDDRIDSVDAKVTIVSLTELSIRIVIRPVDPALTAFAMTLSVTSAAVLLEEISNA